MANGSKGVFHPQRASEAQASFVRLISELALTFVRYLKLELHTSGAGAGGASPW